jgi:hypothetical protein
VEFTTVTIKIAADPGTKQSHPSCRPEPVTQKKTAATVGSIKYERITVLSVEPGAIEFKRATHTDAG